MIQNRDQRTIQKHGSRRAELYDLEMLYKDSLIADAVWGKSYLKDTIGLDESQLKMFSPINQLEHLDIPLLLVHGEKDRRASIEHPLRWE